MVLEYVLELLKQIPEAIVIVFFIIGVVVTGLISFVVIRISLFTLWRNFKYYKNKNKHLKNKQKQLWKISFFYCQ